MARPKDETYVIDLCDRYLGVKASRGHRFDFLLGDPGKTGRRVRLPVDAYYPGLAIVVEFHERQHTEPVRHFDKRIVPSGITRCKQRKKYDRLRAEVLPVHGITLVVLDYSAFDHNSAKKLVRTDQDFDVVSRHLSQAVGQKTEQL